MNSVAQNKELIKKYPWLIPHCEWSDKVIEDYDYSWTELDGLSEGWNVAFGELMCADIQEELEKFNYADKYRVIQLKSKFGEMRLYDNGVPEGCKVHDIIEDYTHLSRYICECCGELDVPSTDDWIMPVCVECIKKMNLNNPEEYWAELSWNQAPHTLPLTRRYRQYNSDIDGWKEFIVDLRPKVQKIRKRYAERKGQD